MPCLSLLIRDNTKAEVILDVLELFPSSIDSSINLIFLRVCITCVINFRRIVLSSKTMLQQKFKKLEYFRISYSIIIALIYECHFVCILQIFIKMSKNIKESIYKSNRYF